MTSFNVISSARSQVLVDEQQLAQLQGEIGRRGEELKRLQNAMETLNAVNAPVHFMAAAMALANELASRWNAQRVGIGILRGRYIRLLALSHTEKITRHMQLVQDIEGAMEECLDQDVEVVVPPGKDASYVYRSTDILAARHGPNAVVSLPLRRTSPAKRTDDRVGNVVAVLLIERKIESPFTLGEIETLRLTCDLFTARLVDLYEHDRWIGAKAARATRRGLAWVLGAKHTWAKLVAIAVAGFLSFALFVDGNFRVEAPFVFQATEQQVIASPIDSRLKTVNANVGDMVFTEATAAPFDELAGVSPLTPLLPPHPPTVLVVLDTAEIVPKLDHAKAEREWYLKQADLYGRDDKQAEKQIALAQADQAAADIRGLEWQISQATIHSPIDGIIFSGDLRNKLGAPVKTGDQLYEVGQLEKLRAELSVPEDEVSELQVDKHGVLKTSSYPDRPVHFTVERIYPIAGVEGAKNIFKVRAALDPADVHLWMRPGIEGLAKVDISKEKYGWIWTHKMINWVRLKVWK